MYKIQSIEIDGFWHAHSVKANFKNDVNVVVGSNGTGKTTFMNILQGILAVDIDALSESQFEDATIILLDDLGHRKTIKATKFEQPGTPFPIVEYKISRNKFILPLMGLDDRSRPAYVRRRTNEEAILIRKAMQEMVSLASLSVYRMRPDIDADIRERAQARRIVSPVDIRLDELIGKLTHYQLELSQRAQAISIDLQKSVLTSLLYEKESDKARSIGFAFDAAEEGKNLVQAYGQLGVTGPAIAKRIAEHVSSIEASVKAVAQRDSEQFDPGSFEAKRRTDKVVKLSLAARNKTDALYSQINLFIKTLSSFIKTKTFKLVAGDLIVEAGQQRLPLEKLSSGEKQLLILLIEAVLQRQRPFIFLADEPELSLHIEWQRAIVPAVQLLNPNAQVIVATHSPEIAGQYPESMIDMEDMLHGAA